MAAAYGFEGVFSQRYALAAGTCKSDWYQLSSLLDAWTEFSSIALLASMILMQRGFPFPSLLWAADPRRWSCNLVEMSLDGYYYYGNMLMNGVLLL